MQKEITWFDLERFGVALRVIPESPLRGIAITCLEIRDRKRYEECVGFVEGLSAEQNQACKEAWNCAREDLGFGPQSHAVFVEDRQYLRLYSTKSEFSLNDLKRLCPGLEAADLRTMLVEDIALIEAPGDDMSAQWKSFAEDVLSNEAIGVWTLRTNPFAKHYRESGPISAVDPGSSGNPVVGKVNRFYGMADKLHRANFRQNALISFYVDLESAVADGLPVDDLCQVDLPFALPLWITERNQIIALSDVRFAPEIMDIGPEQYYGDCKDGIVVDAVRSLRALMPALEQETLRWMSWGAKPDTLEGPEALRDSLSNAMVPIEALRTRFTRFSSDAKHLFDGEPKTIKSLDNLVESDARLIAITASRYLSLSMDRRIALVENLSLAFVRAHAMLGAQVTAEAQNQLRELALAIQAGGQGEGIQQKPKHVDTGEKIGGARKDFARRVMTIDDLELMNEMERKACVVKKNVWPPLNYEQMRDAGVTPQACLAIKYLKDKLAMAPERRDERVNSDLEANYIDSICIVRERMESVRTLDDFGKALSELYAIGSTQNGKKTSYISGGTSMQLQWGSKAATLIFHGEDGRIPPKIRSEIYKKITRLGDEATLEQQWSCLISPKKEKSTIQREEERERVERDRELHRPHLDKVLRIGPDRRSGQDIYASDLIEHFGFRGVEFGNWLPQDERQTVLNMAFDSFCDLAEALDVPPKGLSFDGDLAIAFGSRGRGGKLAALAHFEPALNVFNMTRLNGAGHLAHEWMHALDFHLGQQKGYASELQKGTNSVMGVLSQAMLTRPSSGKELYEKASINSRRAVDNVVSWLYLQPPETRADLKVVIERLYQKADTVFYLDCVKRIEVDVKNPKYKELGFDSRGAVSSDLTRNVINDFFGDIRAGCTNKSGFTKVKDKIEGNLGYMVRNLAIATSVRAANDLRVDLPMAFLSGVNSRDTDFHFQAKRLDSTRSEPYWATTCELFARAGAAFVFDQLDKKGIRSDYLVYGSDEQRYAEHAVGNPNPTGADREGVNTQFCRLMAEYRLSCVNLAESEVGLSH